jgi:hypothetical protein
VWASFIHLPFSQKISVKYVWNPHDGGDSEDGCVLVCSAVLSGGSLQWFQGYLLTPSLARWGRKLELHDSSPRATFFSQYETSVAPKKTIKLTYLYYSSSSRESESGSCVQLYRWTQSICTLECIRCHEGTGLRSRDIDEPQPIFYSHFNYLTL